MGIKVDKPGLWGLLSFAWVNAPIKAARKKEELNLPELYLPEENKTDNLYDEFEKAWEQQCQHARSTGQSRPLLRVLLKTYGKAFFMGGLCKLVWSAFTITGAFYFVRSLLLHVGYKKPYAEAWKGWVLATFFFCFATIWGLALQRMGYICMTTGVKVRAVLLTAVTRKAISMSKVSSELTGDIVSFVANDIGKVYEGMLEFHYLWTAPIEAIAILALVGSQVGYYVLPGCGVVALVLFVQYYFGYRVAQNQYINSKNTHARQGTVQEVLPSMKLVKFYGWEKFFEEKILAIRKLENRFLVRNNVMKIANIVMVFMVPPFTAFTIFSSYEFSYKRLSSTLAFTTLSLFNILRFPLVVLPKALRALSEGMGSLARIEEFLLAIVEHEQKQHDVHAHGIEVTKAVFQYEGESGFKLRVPELTVAPGEVVAIVGRVGSGKTALLQALLGNMECKDGSCKVGGRIAFVPQTAWIQNLSIKDNVLFGNPYDEQRYREVLHACALEPDLKVLPQRDETFGGLRGLNLSGGQRQRVNLARAAYFDADTLLLDNALSAVDHHTAEHIFNHLIKGMFRDKAVVLITHQLCFLRRCNKVAIVDGGDIQYFGVFNNTAQEILARYLPIPHLDDPTKVDDAPPDASKPTLKQTQPPIEERAVTKLSMGPSSLRYLQIGGAWKFFLAVFIAAVAIGSRQASDFWVRFWVTDKFDWFPNKEDHGNSATKKYALGYLGIGFGVFCVLSTTRSIFFLWFTFSASSQLHNKMLRRVLNSPMGLFLFKPVGELLNSFSADQNKADEVLPDTLHYAGVYFFVLFATSVTVSINIPEFAAFAGALAILTFVMLALYLPAATQIKRFRSETAGGLVGLTAEVLEGLPVIQAYSHEKFFVEEFTRQTDAHHRALFNAETLNLWIAFYCDFYGAVMVYAVSAFAVSQRSRGAGVVGLAFSNTIQLLVFYTWTVRLITEAISLSSAIEQLTWLAYFTPIDGKDDVNNAGQKLESDVKWKELRRVSIVDPLAQKLDHEWPVRGTIVFEGVKMRYRPTAGLALNGVHFSISHGEKVGIVGRTGSGKSTLLLALFRMFDLADGRILVSGTDIATLPLKRMRRGLSVIPQEPVMFTGTLRSNLDPYNQHDDDELLSLLDAVGLHEQTLAGGGLSGHVTGTGSGAWSLGQMQLVCLVRAALNKVPIVCLDEATAAMDPHTEKHVLEAIARLFAERTLLTIAHRLDAVISTDTVIVMDKGKVAESGPPVRLLEDRGTAFSKLVDSSGPEEAAILRAEAAKTFARRSTSFGGAMLGGSLPSVESEPVE